MTEIKEDLVEEKFSFVRLTVPQFGELPPKLWFSLFEMELQNRLVLGDGQKFMQLMPRLPASVVIKLEELITTPPAENAYTTAKSKVLEIVQQSRRERIESFLQGLVLGDKKPSTLLQEMRAVAPASELSDEWLKELWMGRLPDSLQAIMSSFIDQDLKQLSQAADNVLKRVPSLPFAGPNPLTAPIQATSATLPAASPSSASPNTCSRCCSH